MNARQLKVWKERELDHAETLVKHVRPENALDIKRIYPEFKLEGVYTTSLEPYVPVWVLLPFFDRIIVTIIPHLRTEHDFTKWYGLSVRQLLALRERGRVEIRVSLPGSTNVTPKYLDAFFSGEFPSSARSWIYDRELLGADNFQTLQTRFASAIGNERPGRSIDGFADHPGRAYKTAETAYLQLHALGFAEATGQFEMLARNDITAAFHWLELCRLFLVGPIHYSLGGIHTVSSSVPALKPPPGSKAMVFPSDLGRILVDAFNLVGIKSSPDSITLDDCVQSHPDYETARRALLALDHAIQTGQVAQSIQHADGLKRMLSEAHSSKEWWLRGMRIVAATGVGIASLPLASFYGLLVGLGFEVISELPGKPFDAGLERVARMLKPKWNRPHITILLELERSLNKAARK